MHAANLNLPILDPRGTEIEEADGFLFGISTRFGVMPSQLKAFWDGTGGLWAKGKLVGKPAGLFFSSATQNGGQETAALTSLTHLAHHGMPYVPLGYTHPHISDLTEVVGGSPYGAGTVSASDGSRLPSSKELELAVHQGEMFARHMASFVDLSKEDPAVASLRLELDEKKERIKELQAELEKVPAKLGKEGKKRKRFFFWSSKK